MKYLYGSILCVLFLSCILIDKVQAAPQSRIFETIEFKGLFQLSKAEIASKAGIMMQDKHFVVDMARLEKSLGEESMIKQYKLIDKKNALTIIVSERESVQTVAVVMIERTLLCETDEQGRLIAAGRAYKKEGPLLILGSDDFANNHFSSRALHLMTLLKQMQKNALWRQMGSVEIRTDGQLTILMNGRPTVFTMCADAENIPLLEAVLSQLDRGGIYPPSADLRNGFAVLKGASGQ